MELSYPSIKSGGGGGIRNLIKRATLLKNRRTVVSGGGGGGRREQAFEDYEFVNQNPDDMTWKERENYESDPRVRIAREKQATLDSQAEYRSFQAEQSMVQEQRMQRDQYLKEQKQSYDMNKDLVYKSIELLNNARTNGNMALQKNLLAGMEGYLRNLDPRMQQLLAPVIQSGPFSPEAEKMRKWDEHNPMPQDFRRVDPSVNPEIYANAWLDQQVWHEGRERFRSGKDPVKRNFARIDKDLVVVRTKDGATVMTVEDMKLESLAKKYGKTPGELILQGGVRGPDRKVLKDGKEVTYGFNIDLAGNRSVEVRGEAPSAEHDKATEWAASYQEWDDADDDEKKKFKNSTIAQAKRLIEEDGMELNEYNERYFRPKFGANLTIAPDGTTGVVYGEPDILERHHVYVNTSGEVFTEYGESLGDYATAAETLRLRLEIAEITEVEEERLLKAKGTWGRGRAGGAFRMLQEKRKSGGASGDF